MACTCDINIKYSYVGIKDDVEYYDVTVSPNGTRNGKSLFSWNDGDKDRVLYWDDINLYWIIAEVVLGVETVIDITLSEDIDCPANSEITSVNWVISAPALVNYFYFNTLLICPSVQIAIAKQKNCFKKKVWQLQCSFATKVGTYFNNLSYGIPCTRSLNDLMIMKYGLEVLNNYNPDDIYNNTTEYNIITYSEIQNILTQLNN